MGLLRRALLNGRLLLDRLSGRPVFESAHYRESEATRLANLFAHADLDRWKGMRVLEVGAGLGRIGDAFATLGFDVTSTDGRPANVERMRARGREAFVLDLEEVRPEDLGGYDLVIAFGVIYHLDDPGPFLRSCGETARVLLLETAVCDAAEPVLQPVKERSRGWRGEDQALHGRGCRPSPAWVERTVREAGFTRVRDVSTAIGNWVIGRFDWDLRDSGEVKRDGMNLRKMWVCEKDVSDEESR